MNANEVIRVNKGTWDRIKVCLDFIYAGKADSLENGKYDLEDGIYIKVSDYDTKDEPKYETHDKYVDIQYIISGEEDIEVADVLDFTPNTEYNEVKDITFGTASGARKHMVPGTFCILLPEDAHAPGLTGKEKCHVKKAVFKVPV